MELDSEFLQSAPEFLIIPCRRHGGGDEIVRKADNVRIAAEGGGRTYSEAERAKEISGLSTSL